jgi:hypothetical protein
MYLYYTIKTFYYYYILELGADADADDSVGASSAAAPP